MDRIRLGVIGAGVMGERLLRAAAEQAADTVELSGVWDPAEAAITRVTAAVPDLRAHGSAAALIEGSDCIYIASPPASHLTHAQAALSAGRAVFCEKPLAVDVVAAQRFTDWCQRTGKYGRFAVNFPFASSFAVDRLRDWIGEGAVGAPRGLQVRVAFRAWPRPWQEAAASWLDAPAEGGFTREVVSHFLFLARRLLGQLTLGSHRVEMGPATESLVEARITAGGVPGTLVGSVGQTEAIDTNTWELDGTGAIRLRDWSIAERRAPDNTWRPDPDALPNERIRPLVLKRQLEGVAAMTRGQPHRLATLGEALEVQEIVEAMLGRYIIPGAADGATPG